MRAIASLTGNNIAGTVVFTQRGELAVIECNLRGVTDGLHGLHVHEFGDMSQGCESMGPHFSLEPHRHGGRMTSERHTGDLGNVLSKNGRVRQRLVAKIQVAHILGRGLVLHANADDLGRGSWPDSGTTGHSGSRIACGIIALAEPK